MGRQIYQQLRPVRARLLAFGLLRAAAWGLLLASLAGIGLGAWRWWTGSDLSPWALALLFIAGPVLGAVFGLARHRTWQTAAHAVDSHYGLKDRAATALAFLANPNPTPWHELQVADAAAHLSSVEPRAVVPFRFPRLIPIAVVGVMLAVALTLVPLTGKKAKAAPAPPREETIARAESLTDRYKALDELAKEEKDETLDKLVKELLKKVEEMKQSGVDVKEELAKLSEMQAAMSAQQAQMNIGLVDGQLQSLGEAMSAADALAAAGQALQDAKFEQAAKELEKLENPDLDKKEAKAVEEKLRQVAKAMGDAGLGQIGDATSELAEGIKSGNKGQVAKGTKGLAGIARSQARRRRIAKLLEAEIENLNEAKGQCKNNGGAKNQVKKKSNSPSQNWGRGVAGNTEGEKTNMLSKRDVKEVTGTAGDEGDSEMETTHSPEGRQKAARGYREAYKKAVKQSEAVLDSEPIPLGHRQTIRKYFELIRPSNDDPSADKSSVDAPPAKDGK